MRSAFAKIVLLVFVAAFIAGCNPLSSSDSSGSGSNIAGTWVGSVFLLGQNTTMTWQLTQNDQSVSGPVTVAQSTGTVLLNGSLSGTVSGSTLTYVITVGAGAIPSLPNCSGQLSGTTTIYTAVPSTMTGNLTVVSSSCPGSFPDATFTLTKQ